jgi:hypothetical protein
MEKYKSIYPTLRQAKTKWSNPSIVAKQGEGPSHDWYEMLKKDARAKLAASIHQSHLGSIHKQERIVREDKVPVFGFKTQLQNIRMKETGVKRKKKMKDPRPTDFSRPDLKEDKIGKQTPSAEQIAKKHGLTIDQVNAQLDKGIPVEREHTNSDEEAREIARDHVHEFPDYYDRLDKMEKKAKKDMKEGYDPEKEQIKNRIEAHKNVAQKMAKEHGEQSVEAAFHRALVKRYEKELGEDSDPVNEAKAKPKKQSKKSWQAMAVLAKKSKDPGAVRKALKAHAKRVNEDVPNSVGGGMSPTIGGEGNIHGFDPIFGKPVRRRKFAGKQVFVVDPTTYHKAYLGKRKYEHYEKYLEGSPYFEEIREYGRKHWDEAIILENEQTGAMVYLKYGSK